MNLLGAVPPPETIDPLERIFRQALVRGAPRPYGVVVEDRSGSWKTTLAELSVESRRATVLAVTDCSALGMAARWSVGGGLVLPPSTATMTDALTAARGGSAKGRLIADPFVFRDLAEELSMLRVTAVPQGRWDHMVGRRGTVECLAALAARLDRLSCIDEGPSLLISGVTMGDLNRAWTEIDNRPLWAGVQSLVIAPAAHKPADPEAAASSSARSWPVAELPSGREVARWTFVSDRFDRTRRTTLHYETDSGWLLDRGGGECEPVPEIIDPEMLADCDATLIRLPGWLTLDLDRTGAPGAVLVKALCREAARRGITLWIPGVTANTLPFVMRLNGRIWVDGSVVPDEGSTR